MLSDYFRREIVVADIWSVASFLRAFERGARDAHIARMNFLGVVVGVKYIVQSPLLVVEGRSVPRAYKVAWTLENRVVGELLPRSANVARHGATYAIVLAFVTVARVEHIVKPLVLDDARSFVHLALHAFPALLGLDAVCRGVGLHGRKVALKLRRDNLKAVLYAHVEEVWRTVVVDKEGVVDGVSLVRHRALLGLFERPCGRVGRRYADALLGRVVHIESAIQVVDLGCPKPLLSVGVSFVQRDASVVPLFKICRGIELYAVRIVRSIGIVGSLVKQDEWVGQLHALLGQNGSHRRA